MSLSLTQHVEICSSLLQDSRLQIPDSPESVVTGENNNCMRKVMMVNEIVYEEEVIVNF